MSDEREVIVRDARAEDEDVLRDLDDRSWTPSSGFPSTLGRGGPFFTDENRPEGHLVAEIDGRVVGYLRLRQEYPMPEAVHVLAVRGLAVAPEVRRHGVAAALLLACEGRARERGARTVRLGVLASNDAARRLYEKHGWVLEVVQEREFFIDGRYVDNVVMVRRLA